MFMGREYRQRESNSIKEHDAQASFANLEKAKLTFTCALFLEFNSPASGDRALDPFAPRDRTVIKVGLRPPNRFGLKKPFSTAILVPTILNLLYEANRFMQMFAVVMDRLTSEGRALKTHGRDVRKKPDYDEEYENLDHLELTEMGLIPHVYGTDRSKAMSFNRLLIASFPSEDQIAKSRGDLYNLIEDGTLDPEGDEVAKAIVQIRDEDFKETEPNTWVFAAKPAFADKIVGILSCGDEKLLRPTVTFAFDTPKFNGFSSQLAFSMASRLSTIGPQLRNWPSSSDTVLSFQSFPIDVPTVVGLKIMHRRMRVKRTGKSRYNDALRLPGAQIALMNYRLAGDPQIRRCSSRVDYELNAGEGAMSGDLRLGDLGRQ
ncbi:hypothetical protein P170DRAFT_482551 [Aspergillus steynii IBT 23096]|uniref:Uncharacterized protein n=1 Tax=Aspergillus steynii IBT 23096 TaxID=1392250 RepID=A0A2I2GMR5_9EURO|nr:uncharacterized protein P170DRAFT_482551 [Aspergillus steynii IBT 23096]PLB54139.1 hypothetical protein P170DRAFT_482551 [Aspergillus steynii IBT 23096]